MIIPGKVREQIVCQTALGVHCVVRVVMGIVVRMEYFKVTVLQAFSQVQEVIVLVGQLTLGVPLMVRVVLVKVIVPKHTKNKHVS